MIFRFMSIDDPTVDIMHVRDCDSRVHERDRWCIDHFHNSDKLAYTIRDNPSHMIEMMGGLWGCRRLDFKNYNLAGLYKSAKTRLYALKFQFGYDQQFLAKCIYPFVKHSFIGYGIKHDPTNTHVAISDTVPSSPYCGQEVLK